MVTSVQHTLLRSSYKDKTPQWTLAILTDKRPAKDKAPVDTSPKSLLFG
jgi:hypothetical protein